MAKRIQGSFLPQPYVVYKKSDINSAAGLNLRSSEWMILTQVNGTQSIQEIAAVTSMNETDVTRIMYNLFQRINMVSYNRVYKYIRKHLFWGLWDIYYVFILCAGVSN